MTSGFTLAENDMSQKKQKPLLVARLLRIELERPECSTNLFTAQIGLLVVFPNRIELLKLLQQLGQPLRYSVFRHSPYAGISCLRIGTTAPSTLGRLQYSLQLSINCLRRANMSPRE
jgi:hypothetical protein